MTETGSADPWADIASGGAEQTVNSRRVDIDHPLDFYWTRDYAGRCGFMLRTRQPIAEKLQKPSLVGIDILIESPAGGGFLLLVLTESPQHDLFRIICHDLLQATRLPSKENETVAVAIILNRLRRWQELLKVRSQGLLSRQAQIGLLGELLILESIFLNRLGSTGSRGCVAWTDGGGAGFWIWPVAVGGKDAALDIRPSAPDYLTCPAG